MKKGVKTQGSMLGGGGGGDGVGPVLKHLQSLRHPSVCECSIGLFRLISVNPVNYDSKERSTEVHV